MGAIKVSPLRKEIYLLLLEGSYAQEIAKRKHLKHQTVQYHIRALEANGVLLRRGGKSYPQFYDKGPNASTFEEATNRLCKDNEKGVNTSQKLRSRTHAKGCIITLVTRAGELHDIQTDNGIISLFPPEPYNSQHGNAFYKGTYEVDGEPVTVQFQRTERGTMLFYVWPPPTMQSAGDLSYQPQAWRACCDRILNDLSRFGGWRFGPARSFSGEAHFAISEDAWFDRSTGLLESETTNLRKAWLWLNIDQLEDQLSAKVDSLEKYAEAVEEQSATKIGNVLQAVNKLADGRPRPPRKGGEWYGDICYR